MNTTSEHDAEELYPPESYPDEAYPVNPYDAYGSLLRSLD